MRPLRARISATAAVVLLVSLPAACSDGSRAPVATDAVTDAATTGDAATGDGATDDGADVAAELPGLLDMSDETLPDDPEVRTGVLDNGLRYYVRYNDNPGSKAELRLAIDAGSVDELGSETGVAHFVEHMLFNGTERFPQNELISVLRSFGAAFGADVNAGTGFDSTVYQLTVANDDDTIASGLVVLAEWLSRATIEPDAVAAERGVVLDEWRIRTQSAEGRLAAEVVSMFLGGTPYEGRLPIGDETSIESMTDTVLRGYYDAHYRPDRAAVVVVGDIDVDDVESAIVDLFGPASARSAAVSDPTDVDHPNDPEPAALVHVDPDRRSVDVEVTLPLWIPPSGSTAALRASLLDEIALDVVRRRLDSDVVSGEAPFDEVVAVSNGFVTGLDAPGLRTVTDAERSPATLAAVLDEFERARRFGFGPTEVTAAVDGIRSRYERLYDGRDSTQDRTYADAYVEDFLLGTGYPSIADTYRTVLSELEAVTPEAVEVRYRARWAATAPHVVVTAPEPDAASVPTESEVVDLVTGLADRELRPRAEGRDLPDELMERPQSVEAVAVDEIVGSGDSLFDPIRVEYANSVTVVINDNDIVEGQIFFQAVSPGGTSLVDDSDVVDALYAAEIVTGSGLGDFDSAEVDRILAGRDVRFEAWLTPYAEQFAGVVSSTDLEALLQIIHQSITAPRVDRASFDRVVNRYGPLVDDPASDARSAMIDALAEIRYGAEPRYDVVPEAEEFATLDPDGVARVWSQRFQNVDEWVFVFSGDVDVDTAIDLAGSYLGTLPTGSTDVAVDVSGSPPDRIVEVERRAGTGDTAALTVSFSADVDEVTAEILALADVVTELLTARLVDVVREELGDSYAPVASSSVRLDPDPTVETYVSVTGSPDRVGSLADIVVAELTDLVGSGASDREYSDAFAQVAERYRFVDNGLFIDALLRSETDPGWGLDVSFGRVDVLAALGSVDVEEYLGEYLPVDRYVQVTVTPRGS